METLFDIQGQFLVAEDILGDANFSQTVVLMVSHGIDGAFGLVINRPSQLSLGEAAPAFAESKLAGRQLFIGGPVEQEFLFTLHETGQDIPMSGGASLVMPGLVFEPDFIFFERETAPKLLAGGLRFKLIAGYAGWSGGQLEDECSEGAWFVLRGQSKLVFSPFDDECWHEALRSKGGIYWALAETGFKPSMN